MQSPPAELDHCYVFYLGTASSPAERGDPGWADGGLRETIPPDDPLDSLPLEHPGSSPGKTHSSAEGFAGHMTLCGASPASPGCMVVAPGPRFGVREVGNGRGRERERAGERKGGG